jgi:phosphatidate cytidylyltransferase
LKEFIIRSLSGALFVLIMLSSIWLSEYSLFILLQIIGILAIREYFKLSFRLGFHPLIIPGIISGIYILSISFFVASGYFIQKFLILLILPFIILPVIHLFYQPDRIGHSFSSTFSGLIYVYLPLSIIPFISFYRVDYNFQILMGFLAILWTYDSFAYLSGVMFGRHKIYPKVSPKKSWEGLAGGLLFALVISWCISRLSPILSPENWIIITVIIIIAGTLGDFFESALKREAGVKDSGNLMPGHGGILDRFDSILFSVPFVYLYLTLIRTLQ